MDATTVGATLRAERLRRCQQLTTIAAETKIRREILEALENDEFDHIPGGAYRRSFLRQYARTLELDEDEVVATFQQQYIEPPLPLPVPPKTKPFGYLPGLVCLVLAAVGFAGLYRVAQSAHPEKGYDSAVPVRLSQHAGQERPKPDTTTSTASADRLAPTVMGPSRNDAPAGTASSADSSTPAVHVTFNVMERVWVSVKCDGNESYTGVLAPPESKMFEATHTVTVLIGNAGGVSILVNGSPVGPIGAHGEIQLLELTPSGVRRLPRHLAPPTERTPPPET
jgi:cytoskeletal protein RodZ